MSSNKEVKVFKTIQVELGEPKNEFPEWGLSTYPVLLRDDDGKRIESGRRFVLKHDIFKSDVSERYTLLANEEALMIANTLADQLGYKNQKTLYTRDDRVMAATFVSDKFVVEPKIGDVIKLGFTVLNSIDGSKSFGAELFSFRLSCANGAMMRASEGGMLSLRKHIGEAEKMKASLEEQLAAFLDMNLTPLAKFYKALPQIRLNLEIAQALAKSIPKKHLPPVIQVERKTKLADITGEPDLFTVYNDVTENLWYSDSIDLNTQAKCVSAMHQVFAPLVARVAV